MKLFAAALLPLTTASHRSVLHIDSESSFTETVSQGEQLVFVNYGTVWCTHCQTMRPEWEKLAELTDKDVIIANVDCMELGNVCIDENIATFPTLKLYENGEVIANYESTEPRTLEAFETFIDQYRNPLSLYQENDVVDLNDASFNKVVDGDQMTVVAYGISWCVPCKGMEPILASVAEKSVPFKGDVRIAQVDCGKSSDLCYEQGITEYPTIVAYRDGKELVDGRIMGLKQTVEIMANIVKLVDEKPMVKRNILSMDPFETEAADSSRTLDDAVETQFETDTFSLTDDNGSFAETNGHSSKCRKGYAIYDPEVEDPLKTGCWAYDPEMDSCSIQNPSCLVLDCMVDRMAGFIRADAFNDPNLINEELNKLNREVEFDEKRDALCDAEFKYDPIRRGITFEIKLGECGMEAEAITKNEQDYIKFSEKFSFASPSDKDTNFSIYFANYFSSHFGFHCYYSASTTTLDSDYSVSTKIYNSDIEKYVNWDSTFELSFFDSEQYTTSSDPANLFIGDSLYVRTAWRQDFSASFPVEFYLEMCTISSQDSEARFDVIKEGCFSSLVQAKNHSNGIYHTHKMDFSYVSFSFQQHQARYDMKLQCKINFCLKFDRSYGTCGAAKVCPSGYYHPSN